MFDVGWQELFLIAVVALIVVGPKDLPHVLRGVSRFVTKARAMSREFQSGLAEMAREAELDEIKRKVQRAAQFDPAEELKKSIDPTGKLSADFDPAEFNRKLKESVEGGPPTRPAVPRVDTAVDPVVDTAVDPAVATVPAAVPAEAPPPPAADPPAAAGVTDPAPPADSPAPAAATPPGR